MADVINIERTQGDTHHELFRVAGMGDISGMSSTLTIWNDAGVELGVLAGTVIDGPNGDLDFDVDDDPEILAITPGIYSYTIVVNGDEERTVVEGNWVVKARRAP